MVQYHHMHVTIIACIGLPSHAWCYHYCAHGASASDLLVNYTYCYGDTCLYRICIQFTIMWWLSTHAVTLLGELTPSTHRKWKMDLCISLLCGLVTTALYFGHQSLQDGYDFMIADKFHLELKVE